MMKLSSIVVSTTAIAIMAVAIMETSGQSSPSRQPAPSTHMTNLHAKGIFEVTLKPLPPANPEAGAGTMDRGKPQSTIVVVPDSGTEQLAGLAGNFRIDIKDGKHFYEFEYTISK